MDTPEDWVEKFCYSLNLSILFGWDSPKYEFFKDHLLEEFKRIYDAGWDKGFNEFRHQENGKQ